jgi:hypothetical protein
MNELILTLQLFLFSLGFLITGRNIRNMEKRIKDLEMKDKR